MSLSRGVPIPRIIGWSRARQTLIFTKPLSLKRETYVAVENSTQTCHGTMMPELSTQVYCNTLQYSIHDAAERRSVWSVGNRKNSHVAVHSHPGIAHKLLSTLLIDMSVGRALGRVWKPLPEYISWNHVKDDSLIIFRARISILVIL